MTSVKQYTRSGRLLKPTEKALAYRQQQAQRRPSRVLPVMDQASSVADNHEDSRPRSTVLTVIEESIRKHDEPSDRLSSTAGGLTDRHALPLDTIKHNGTEIPPMAERYDRSERETARSRSSGKSRARLNLQEAVLGLHTDLELSRREHGNGSIDETTPDSPQSRHELKKQDHFIFYRDMERERLLQRQRQSEIDTAAGLDLDAPHPSIQRETMPLQSNTKPDRSEKSITRSRSSTNSRARLELQQKQLKFEMEVERSRLRQQQQKAETDEKMRLLQIQEELAQEQLKFESQNDSDSDRSVYSDSNHSRFQRERCANWVGDTMIDHCDPYKAVNHDSLDVHHGSPTNQSRSRAPARRSEFVPRSREYNRPEYHPNRRDNSCHFEFDPDFSENCHDFTATEGVKPVHRSSKMHSRRNLSERRSNHEPSNPGTWIDRLDEMSTERHSNPATWAWDPHEPKPEEIGIFSGKPEDWPEFSLSFKCSVHDRQHLTRSQKLGILRKCLGEIPKSKVYGLLWDEANYSAVLRELKRRYGNSTIVVEAFVTKVRNWPPLNNAGDLISYSTQVSQLIQVFQTMNFTADLQAKGLLSDMVSKLSPSMRESWGGYVQCHGEPSVLMFQNWLQKREDAISLGGGLPANKSKGPIPVHKPSNSVLRPTYQHRSTNIVTKPDPSPNECDKSTSCQPETPMMRCYFCNSCHWIEQCPRLSTKTDDEIGHWYITEGRCFRCSERNHRANGCTSRHLCGQNRCRGRHSRLLHGFIQTSRRDRDRDSGQQNTERERGQRDSHGQHDSERDHVRHDGERDQARHDCERERDQGRQTDPKGTEATKLFSQNQNIRLGEKTPEFGDVDTCDDDDSYVHLQILPIRIHSDQGYLADTYALIDPGSQSTLITKRMASKLELTGRTYNLTLGNIVKNTEPRRSQKVNFRVSDPNQSSQFSYPVHCAWTLTDTFNLPSQIIPRDETGRPVWTHISDLGLQDINGTDVELLIGGNCKHLMRELEFVEGPDDKPDAVRFPIGWALRGATGAVDEVSTPVPKIINSIRILSATPPENPDEKLPELIERFWSIDTFGCKYNDEQELSQEDRYALNFLDSTTCKGQGRYIVSMLWRQDFKPMPSNYYQALQMYMSTRKKLLRDPTLDQKYRETMNGYIARGHARLMTPIEARQQTDKTHHLSHHGVWNETKGKLRVVFNAAMEYKGISLNDNLLSGPDLTNLLLGVLLRFREGAVAISADIEQMFHQVRVPEADREALRVLWSENLDEKPDTYQMLVHVFGAACSPACANYALKRTARDNTGKFSEESLAAITRSFYVDDFLKSCKDEETAKRIALEVIQICATASFKLTKWVSTSQAVLDSVSSEEGIVTDIDLDLDNTPTSRVLGVHWDVKADMFVFKSREPTRPETLRGMTGEVCSCYDPPGFLAPFIIRAKFLIQRLWSEKKHWDEDLNTLVLQIWRQWLAELSQLGKFKVHRTFWPADMETAEVQLHFFCDASEKAFAAVSYIRVVSADGRIHISFVMSRSRVAPLGCKVVSLVRLELQGAVLAARIYDTLKRELDISTHKVIFWTDSTTVLRYISNENRRFKTFVGNRVAEIRSVTSPEQWKHVPGTENPADDATRGKTIHEITSEGDRWLNGASFLWSPESEWNRSSIPDEVAIDDPEVKVSVSVVTKQQSHPENVFEPERFSSLKRLLRVTAIVFRYTRNLRKRVRLSVDKIAMATGPLKAAEVRDAELFWIRTSQTELYPDEYQDLSKGKPTPRNSPLKGLRPMIENEFMRVGGRLENAYIPYDARHQYILPPDHPLTHLLIIDTHERLAHAGVPHVVAQMRQTYWVVRLRQVTKRLLRKCLLCHRNTVQPAIPVMGQLPFARVSANEPVFLHTGVDYFGPIKVKERRQDVRRWVALFTSMSIRAVHLELVRSLDTDSFILAFERFVNRRGRNIRHIYCDNGTNFVGAVPELREAIDRLNSSNEFHQFLTYQNLEWHFNPPKAPHMGGAWERLVQSVKRSMRAVLKDRTVHEDTLATVLTHVESIVNSRPLTPLGDDPDDLEPLTPNHFLIHSHAQDTASDIPENCSLSSRQRWRQSQSVTNDLWKRFLREYLPPLTVSHKWTTEKRNLAVNDLVLIVEQSSPRGIWPMGRVLEVFTGSDGRVRSANLKTKSGTLKRPVSQLCVLEEAA